METRNDNTGGSSHEVNANMETQGKRSYRSPRLMTYGDLSRLTMAKGGAGGDGSGNPMTMV